MVLWRSPPLAYRCVSKNFRFLSEDTKWQRPPLDSGHQRPWAAKWIPPTPALPALSFDAQHSSTSGSSVPLPPPPRCCTTRPPPRQGREVSLPLLAGEPSILLIDAWTTNLRSINSTGDSTVGHSACIFRSSGKKKKIITLAFMVKLEY